VGYVIERVDGSGAVRYLTQYRDIKGRLRSAGTHSSRDEALDAIRTAERGLEEGKIGDPRRGRQTLRHFVETEWFPNHMIEATTREGYRYILDRYVLSELGGMRMVAVLPGHVREWILRLQKVHGARPPTIQRCKVVLDSIFTTALNDQIVFLHPGKGVKIPPVVRKPQRVITAGQFDAIYVALGDQLMRLLVETDIESGLRWGELTELRVKDLDFGTGVLTISRVVVELKAKNRPDGIRFIVKHYPKDKEWRQLRLAPHIVDKLRAHREARGLGPDDLLFAMPEQALRPRPEPLALPDPDTLGMTEPNEQGRSYRHGTTTGYTLGRCRCGYCRAAMTAYRADRRAAGKDRAGPTRASRVVDTDGHISNDWFRVNVWNKALTSVELGFRVTPHGLRHAHASWLLAGGADLQVVKERLGHGSISTTERYLHTLPGADDAALDALDKIRSAAASSAKATNSEPEEVEDAAEMRRLMTKFKRFMASVDETA
jgi:integrase